MKSVTNIHWKDWCWSWNSHTWSTWCEELTHLRGPWCCERLRAGERGDRGWDGWMASPAQRTWVSVDSGCWWWSRRPGVLWFVGSQRVRHHWATELNWTPVASALKMYSLLLRHQEISMNTNLPNFFLLLFEIQEIKQYGYNLAIIEKYTL